MKNPKPDPDQSSAIRQHALDLLALREHSRSELSYKLTRRTQNQEVIAQVLDELAQANLQSDSRYAEAYARSRVKRGYGPAALARDLRGKHVSQEIVRDALSELDVDWQEEAAAVREKKFGPDLPQSTSEQAKQSRFLNYRGFESEHIRGLFRR